MELPPYSSRLARTNARATPTTGRRWRGLEDRAPPPPLPRDLPPTILHRSEIDARPPNGRMGKRIVRCTLHKPSSLKPAAALRARVRPTFSGEFSFYSKARGLRNINASIYLSSSSFHKHFFDIGYLRWKIQQGLIFERIIIYVYSIT